MKSDRQYLVRIDDGSSDDWARTIASDVREAAVNTVAAAVAHGMSLHGGPISTMVRAPDGTVWKALVHVEMEPTFYAGGAKLIR